MPFCKSWTEADAGRGMLRFGDPIAAFCVAPTGLFPSDIGTQGVAPGWFVAGPLALNCGAGVQVAGASMVAV